MTIVILTLLSAVVLWLLVSTKGAWAPRAIAVVCLLAAGGLLLWPQADDGAPTSASPPDNTRFAGCVVQEKQGFIYLWLISDNVPHGYRQPYTRDLHQVCVASQQASGMGIPVGFKKLKGPPPGRVNAQQVPKNHFRPYVLPPASAGPKE